jgi:hypothetical protein
MVFLVRKYFGDRKKPAFGSAELSRREKEHVS